MARRIRPLRAGLGLVAAAGLALVAVGCRPAVQPVPEADIARAEEALQPFKEELFAELVLALGDGPESAVKVCAQRAHVIARAHSVDGVVMGRTSHRLRNPDNAPRAWVEPLLAAALADPESAAPMAVWIDEATVGYVEPIRIQAMCVSCHGPRVEGDLLAEIRAVYPEDAAVGFKAGDLRGLFWVELPATGV